MTRLRKYFEALSNGRRTHRVAYVINVGSLPRSVAGAEWQEDHSFNAAAEILAQPNLKAIYKTAIEEGCAGVTQL